MTGDRFISRPIEVIRDEESGDPLAFEFEGNKYAIEEILAAWQDWGFPGGAPKRKDWRMRRHRNFYRVSTSGGEVFEIYHDRGTKPGVGQWILYSRVP